jgi:hypothetical protein
VLYLWDLGASGYANSLPKRCRPARSRGRRGCSGRWTRRTSSRSTSRRPRCGQDSVGTQITGWVAAHYTATTVGGTTVYDLTPR